jgi:hypothetical protein
MLTTAFLIKAVVNKELVTVIFLLTRGKAMKAKIKRISKFVAKLNYCNNLTAYKKNFCYGHKNSRGLGAPPPPQIFDF